MLELKNIKKEYPAGNGSVKALKGIDLQFRRNEFVAILGPSGCGKTTMLNLIGGLDQYTEGDLIINGRSTRDFRDRDWDAYRNHSVGFVFQSYNLITHQSVLQNVELALSLSGVGKAQRRKRAIQALQDVGLGDQLRKKPGEMSGGQMQRVAIARALVNNPDIILADEPTGALDTQTSEQVMEILKEVSKDRLVIMVTHNPELAQKYATRTIRMLDGCLLSDSMPLTPEELQQARAEDKARLAEAGKRKLPSMRLSTAFGLSLKNLLTKRGRTMLTSFAGSIGIIGIALIFAVSQGMTTYINTLQEDTLSSYPLTIQANTIELSSLISAFMESADSTHNHENDAVYSKPAIYNLINAINSLETTENDLAAFKQYLDSQLTLNESSLSEAVSGIQYSYDLNLQVFTKNIDGTVVLSDTEALTRDLMKKYMAADMSAMADMQGSSPFMSMMSPGSSMSMTLWQEMLPGTDGSLINPILQKQYDLVYGAWPNSYDEIILVLDENNELDDMTLYALGLKSEEEMGNIIQAVSDGRQLPVDTHSWSYEEICEMDFRVILPGSSYRPDELTGVYHDLRASDAGMRYLYDNGITLRVSGIVRPSENAVSSMLTGSIGYTSKLTEYIIRQSADSPAVSAQKANPGIDIFTGLPFRESAGLMSDAEKEAEFRSYVAALSDADKIALYVKILCIPSPEQIDAAISQTIGNMTRQEMEESLVQGLTAQMAMDEQEIRSYVSAMTDEELTELFSQAIAQRVTAQHAAQVQAQAAATEPLQLLQAMNLAMEGYTTEQCASYYDAVLEFSDSNLESNLIALGCLDLKDPSAVNLYAATFESKDIIEDAISAYNESVDELHRITYTDYVGLMMSSVTSIINAITYVLIAFVSISLVVSSIMIGVITLISVQERTKEIGILRAIGASKKNVSSMFSAETMIIGFTSGALGVLITYLLCIPINAIIYLLTDIPNLKAFLPTEAAIALIVISVVLTLFAGIIPSRSAARKDPVVALRVE